MNAARRKEITRLIDQIELFKNQFEDVKNALDIVAQEEREYFDNMPESMQSGDKGEAASAAADELEEAHNALTELDLDDVISKLDNAKGES